MHEYWLLGFTAKICFLDTNNLYMNMFNRTNRTYVAPSSAPTEVAFERSLLVATARLVLDVDESQNMNIKDASSTVDPDGPGGEMYFEF